MDTPLLRRLYWRFYKAARKRDAATVAQLLRDSPELRAYAGPAGTPLEILDHSAPELLECAFEVRVPTPPQRARRCSSTPPRRGTWSA